MDAERHVLIEKAIRQYREGVLTYPDLMEALLRLESVPCSCLGCS